MVNSDSLIIKTNICINTNDFLKILYLKKQLYYKRLIKMKIKNENF